MMTDKILYTVTLRHYSLITHNWETARIEERHTTKDAVKRAGEVLRMAYQMNGDGAIREDSRVYAVTGYTIRNGRFFCSIRFVTAAAARSFRDAVYYLLEYEWGLDCQVWIESWDRVVDMSIDMPELFEYWLAGGEV